MSGSRTIRAGALLCILLLLCPYVAADGMVYTGEDQGVWSLAPEHHQLASITYTDGMENLLLSVSTSEALSGDHAVWIVPVPASPDRVSVDILKGFPAYQGTDLDYSYTQAVGNTFGACFGYGAFPASLILILPTAIFGLAGHVQSASMSDSVTVHEHIEKMGLTTDVVTAQDGTSIRSYLEERNITLPSGSAELLTGYSGYSYVITYVSDVDRFNREVSGGKSLYYNPYTGGLGVFVSFPTEKIYFPMKLTSAYGNRRIPVYLYVNSFVAAPDNDYITPTAMPEYNYDGSGVNHYIQPTYNVPDSLLPFFNNQQTIAPLKYTRIIIQRPAEQYTTDIWINPIVPPEYPWKEGFITFAWAIGVLVFVVLSLFCGLAAGLICMQKTPATKKELALHGLWNSFTLIGFTIATRRKFDAETYRHRTAFIIIFYLIFWALLALIAYLLTGTFTHESFWWVYSVLIVIVLPLLPLYYLSVMPILILPVAAIIAFWIILKYTNWLPAKREPAKPAAPVPEEVPEIPCSPEPASPPEIMEREVHQAAPEAPVTASSPPVSEVPVQKTPSHPSWTPPPAPGSASTRVHVPFWQPILAEFRALPAYERRWSSVLLAAVLMVIAGSLINTFTGEPVLTALGMLTLWAAMVMYSSAIFGIDGMFARIVATGILAIPLAVCMFLTVEGGIANIIVVPVVAVILSLIVLLCIAALTKILRAATGKPAPITGFPNLRVIAIFIIVASILMTPVVLKSIGSGDPRASALVRDGDELAAKGDYTGAADDYGKALEYDPGYDRALTRLMDAGDALAVQGKNRLALDTYARVIQKDPHNLRALVAHGDMLRTMNYCSSAKLDYAAALKLDPSNAAIKERLEAAERAC